ncbi:hypothetical protein P8918_12600 [Bacillus spizizenii]|nr:hypothetical protein [Bacillus spizizenii]MEC0841865.1 hypothetical protein [Bacillus spizizenii]
MSKIALSVKKENTELSFEAEGAQEDHVAQVIEGMFRSLSVNVVAKRPIQSAPAPSPRSELSSKPLTIAQNASPTERKLTLADLSAPVNAAPKHVENNTTIVGEPKTMEEAFPNTEDKAPTHYKTGYKIKDGVKHYKCRYRCTKCRNAGNHYIPEGVEQVDCHECQTSLMVKKATPGAQGIQPDKFMNWFVAGNQLPVSEFVYGTACVYGRTKRV